MPTYQSQNFTLVLFYQIRVSVVGAIFNLACALSVWYQALQFLLINLKQLLVEQDLLGNDAKANLVVDEYLRLLTDVCDEEHKGIGERLTLATQFTIILASVFLERLRDLRVHKDDYLLMVHAWSQADHLFRVLHYEIILASDELIRLLLQEKFLKYVKEAMRVKVQEKRKKFFICEESNDIVDETSPFERAERTRRELFTFHEQADYPKQLVADVGSAVLNL